MNPLPKLPNIPRPIKKLFRSPIVVVSAASLGVRIGKEAYRFHKGEIDAKELRARTGAHFGSISGGMVGAAAGAAALSAVPGVGTVLGAFAGGLVGETFGQKLGRRAAERFEDVIAEPAVAAAPASDATGDASAQREESDGSHGEAGPSPSDPNGAKTPKRKI